MPSQRQIDANRRNAKKSTGPQTPEGLAAVGSNALRHGLTAQTAVLANENREHFDEMLEAFQAEYHPAGPTENLLVHQMVTAAWRLARMRGIETGLFNLGLSDLQDELETNYTGIEENDRQAFVFRNDAAAPRSIENLFRYESRIERSFYRALHELQRIRAGGPSVHDPVGGDGQSAKTDSANQSQSQDRTPLPIQAHDRFDVKSLPARAKQGQTTASTVRISSEVEAGRRLGRRSQSLFRKMSRLRSVERSSACSVFRPARS